MEIVYEQPSTRVLFRHIRKKHPFPIVGRVHNKDTCYLYGLKEGTPIHTNLSKQEGVVLLED